MCKFTNRLFVFALLGPICLIAGGVIGAPMATPAPPSSALQPDELQWILDLLGPDYTDDYDLHYDQRQKGNQNVRLKMDGFFLGLPVPEEPAEVTVALMESLATQLLMGVGRHNPATASAENLIANKLEADDKRSSNAENKPSGGTIIVAIPAPKKESEARHQSDYNALDENLSKPRPRLYVSHLLNLLKRSRKV